MTVRPPRIVVTLPARGHAEAVVQVERARTAGADLAEIRFDRWPPEERASLERVFPTPLPLVATLRSRAEGGEGPDDGTERSAFLEAAARLPFAALDLEAARDLTRPLTPRSVPGPLRIVSTHLPPTATAGDVARALRFLPPGAVRKVVVPSSVQMAVRDLLPLLNGEPNDARVVLTTGASGQLFRAWSYRLGYPFVFARLPPSESGMPEEALESSQLPVDRLRPFFGGGPDAPLFAIVGHPVGHSQSPFLHSRWMRASQRAGMYIALDVEGEAEFVESLPVLASSGFRGINVTHPWKSVALATASRVDRAAEAVAAANCLTFRDDEVEASNTDLAAILRRLEEYRSESRWDGREIAVVGAGGAAAATLAAARQMSAEAYVIARGAEPAAAAARRFEARAVMPGEDRRFSLVVNATPVGRAAAGPLEVPVAPHLEPGGLLLDWVYAPDRRDLAEAAERASCGYEDGWRLLVYQAAVSFGLWWGDQPPEPEIAAAVKEGPCAE
jgi:shikimate dehydrogenase